MDNPQIKNTLKIKDRIKEINYPIIMGILNLSPDSFFDGGKYIDIESMLKNVRKMIEEGATIIDIGGNSTRPGSVPVSVQEELKRVIDPIKLIRAENKEIILSVDTFHSRVAEEAVKFGADMINDISSGNFDQNMIEVVAELNVPYVMMHIKGNPQTMQENPCYDNVVNEVLDFFQHKLDAAYKAGINDVIIDPGFGFGKSLIHNYSLLSHLSLFKVFGLPILAGLSRKSMIYRVIEVSPQLALNGTTVLNTLALLNGASILRVHDVKEAMECIKLVSLYQSSLA